MGNARRLTFFPLDKVKLAILACSSVGKSSIALMLEVKALLSWLLEF